jgi:hypothetical protein
VQGTCTFAPLRREGDFACFFFLRKAYLFSPLAMSSSRFVCVCSVKKSWKIEDLGGFSCLEFNLGWIWCSPLVLHLLFGMEMCQLFWLWYGGSVLSPH